MAAKSKQEVAPAKDERKTALTALPEGMSLAELEADAGQGVDNMGMDDVAVPYLYVLQANSPQVNPDHTSYVPGATAGMFLNSVSGEVFDGRTKGLIVIPCAYERSYVEWVHRDDGGGFVQEHAIDSGILEKCHPDDKGRPRLPNNHTIVETAYHYVYMFNPLSQMWEEIIIPMKSTMLKKSRRWNKTLVSTYIPGTEKKAPRWLYPYKLMTEKEVKGDNTWSNIKVDMIPEPVSREQYLKAKAFAELFALGNVVKSKETIIGDDGGQTIDHDEAEPHHKQSAGMREALKGEIPF